MKKVHILSAYFFCLSIFILSSLPSCEISEKVFIEPVPVAQEATEVTAKAFLASWTPVLGANSYVVQIALTSDFASVVQTIAVDTLSARFENLLVDQEYFYRVQAQRGDNLTEFSNIVRVSTTSIGPPDLTSIEVVDTNATNFEICWEAVDGAESYFVEVSDLSDFSSLLVERSTDTTCLVITGLIPNESYFVRISSRTNTTSNPSSSLGVQTLDLPAPTALAASDVSPIFFNTVWEELDGALEYSVEIADDADFENILFSGDNLSTTTFPVRLFSVRVGKTYYYRVKARSANSESPFSNVVEVNSNIFGDSRLTRIVAANTRNNSIRRFTDIIFEYDNQCRLSEITWQTSPSSLIDAVRRRVIYASNGKVNQVIQEDFIGVSPTVSETW
ncbi:MAG: hypothetical protein AAFU64_12430, partial [Bacteroidota bacterium]